MMGYGMMGGTMGFWMLLHMLFWGLIVAGIILLIIRMVTKTKGTALEPRQESALDILKKRYAKGEIDKEEFEEKKKDLL